MIGVQRGSNTMALAYQRLALLRVPAMDGNEGDGFNGPVLQFAVHVLNDDRVHRRLNALVRAAAVDR